MINSFIRILYIIFYFDDNCMIRKMEGSVFHSKQDIMKMNKKDYPAIIHRGNLILETIIIYRIHKGVTFPSLALLAIRV